MSKTQIKVPAHVYIELSFIASKRMAQSKSVIIEDDGFHFNILTEDYQGNVTLAARATHPNPLQQKPTGPG